MAIEEAINVVTTAIVIGNTISGIKIDVNGDASSHFQKNWVSDKSPETLF